MKIETASLERGAPVRRIVFDDARPEATDKPKASSGWAWAASLARYAFGHEQPEPEQPEQEMETR